MLNSLAQADAGSGDAGASATEGAGKSPQQRALAFAVSGPGRHARRPQCHCDGTQPLVHSMSALPPCIVMCVMFLQAARTLAAALHNWQASGWLL
jgi:hypothetical protein